MRCSPRSLLVAVCATALLTLAQVASACDVPVFRYALERWAPSSYDLVVFHKGELTGEHKANIEALRKFSNDESGYANYTLTTLDVTDKDKLTPDAAKLWEAQKNPAALPYVVLRYPDSRLETPPLYTGPLTGDLSQALIDSPARRTIAQRLLAGDSAVFVFLETGDKAKDDKAFDVLAKQLKVEQSLLKLPEIDPEDPSNANKLRAEVPLKLAFSTLRIARTDPKEHLFVDNLLKWDEDLAKNEPAVFPILGRGRALPGLAGKDFNDKVLTQYCEFIVGRCSCEVKEQNPGFDVLMSADWEAPLQNRLVKDPPFPQLMGLSALASASQPGSLTLTNATSSATVTRVGPITVTATGSNTLPLVLGATVAALVIAVGFGAAVLMMRKPHA